MKRQILAFFLMSSSFFNAQFVISNEFYAVDHEQKILLSNYNVDVLNTIHYNTISALFMGEKIYIFSTPVENVEVGNAYDIYQLGGDNYRLYFTKTPIIQMTTTAAIQDSPKVLGNFEMLVPGEDNITATIGVEYRGATSQSYPKKSMEIEFWKDEVGDDTEDISLAGLPAQDSWNLQAMYNENLKLNSKAGFELWEKIHPDAYYKNDEPESRTGIRMEYADLFLNGKYMGVYGIGEKVKRGYLKLKKFKDDQIKGELYKGDDWGGPDFGTLLPYDNTSDIWNGFEYKYPNEIIDWSNLHTLVDFVMNAPDEEFYAKVGKEFISDNILDYFIFINVLRAKDNTGKNVYFAKYKNNDGYFFVPWDLDGTFGYDWQGNQDNVTDDLLFNTLYARLWENKQFRNSLSARWSELRTDVLKFENIQTLLESNFNFLKANGVYNREELVWNQAAIPQTQWQYMNNWLEQRLSYLDSVFIPQLGTSELTKIFDVKVVPNPIRQDFRIYHQQKTPVKIALYDYNGRKLYSHDSVRSGEVLQLASWITRGNYFMVISDGAIIKTVPVIIE